MVRGSPSAALGQVAEERISVHVAMCLSVNKAECPFALQSLTWDPGFCTEHFLLHTCLAVWASYSPALSSGCHRGCVSVRPHKEDGVWCAMHVNRHPPGDRSVM